MGKHEFELRLCKLLNTLVVTSIFGFYWFIFYANSIADPFFEKGNYMVIFVFFLLYVLFIRIYDGFLVSYQRISELIYSQVLSVIIADSFMFLIIWLLIRHIPNFVTAFITLGIQIIFIILWSKGTHDWYFKTFDSKITAVIYDQRDGLDNLINEYGLEKKFKVIKVIHSNVCIEDLGSIDDCEVVFFSGVHSHERNIILKRCIEKDITSFIIPRVGDTIMSGAKKMYLFHLPILRVGRYNPDLEFLFFKRMFDIVVSIIALVVLSPIFLIACIAIKSDGGPAFYKQCRLTKDGKEFYILKFRSMRVDAEKDGVARSNYTSW